MFTKVFLVCLFMCLAVMGEEVEPRARVRDFEVDSALNNPRYIQRQIKCALGEVPCDSVGRRLKSLAPLVLRGSCPQCTREDSIQIKKVLSIMQRKYPQEWNKILKKYAGV